MGKCGSKNIGPVDRLGKDYDYLAGAGTSGFGVDYNRNGYGGYGSGSGGYGLGSSCPEGVNQNTALLATAAAIAVGAGVIYRAVTLQQAGKRRKREVGEDKGIIQDRLLDLIALGMENFEEKISKPEYIEEGETWTAELFRDFSRYKTELEEEMNEENIEINSVSSEIEPPSLESRWGLEQESSGSDGVREETEEFKNLDDTNDSTCKAKVWRCLSKVLESGVKHMEKPGGLWRLVQAVLYKTAFHGQSTSVWTSLMGLPQVLGIVQCVRHHDKCVAEEIVADAAEVRGRLRGGMGRYIVNDEWSEEEGDEVEAEDTEILPLLRGKTEIKVQENRTKPKAII